MKHPKQYIIEYQDSPNYSFEMLALFNSSFAIEEFIDRSKLSDIQIRILNNTSEPRNSGTALLELLAEPTLTHLFEYIKDIDIINSLQRYQGDITSRKFLINLVTDIDLLYKYIFENHFSLPVIDYELFIELIDDQNIKDQLLNRRKLEKL